MPENGIKMLAMTANCGNGDIGGSGISGIISSIRAKQADIAVINCQEAEVASIMNSLNNGLKDAQLSNFGCVQSELFRTRTKVAQWVPFSNETGIVSVVLFNKDKFNVTHENSNRHVSKTNSNKGCLSSLFSVSSLEDDKKFTIQTISGHLESNNADKRISDWHKLRESISKYAGTDSFDDFASKIPDITITGADLNTRDLDVADENKRNPWNNVSKNSDMKSIRDVRSMHFASVGAQSFTAETTYKTHKPDVEKDSKGRNVWNECN